MRRSKKSNPRLLMNTVHEVTPESLAVCKVWLFRSPFRT